ncbi:MAG: nucleotidyltransferase family protein [Desulfuromusa sp.]|nr:nucleotidyltransferase family protein [Desulfuromusa sp.]
MKRAEVLRILSQHQEALAQRYGVTKLGIFGSVARDESTPSSDVDVVIEMAKPDLFYMVHIKQELEDALHCPVDIVHYRPHMNHYLKKRINRDGIYV